MPVPVTEADLERVNDRASLFTLLSDSLGWPVDEQDAFTYDLPAIGESTAGRVNGSRIVPFTANDPYLLLLLEFTADIRRKDLRDALRAVRRDVRQRAAYGSPGTDDIVFVCALPDYTGIRFAHFAEQPDRAPRLSVFGWDGAHLNETRTLRQENLQALHLQKNLLDQPDWAPETKKAWHAAWDVETVTRDFFRDFKKHFEAAAKSISGVRGDTVVFRQRIFNRLLFIRFLERKGWLRYNGRQDYLHTLWDHYLEHGDAASNFYRDVLRPLFFDGLNNPYCGPQSIGEVPYLNGGLFEEEPDEKLITIRVEDEAVRPFIEELLYRYNFTITESTPDDVDVAVDPEMLGKVFEELVTGRHESGSYYTPKSVVSFMCREAIKGYLGSVTSEDAEAISRFVDARDPGGIRDGEATLATLKRVTACDPACGSGAYLLGMLHEILDLRLCLFRSKQIDAKTVYERKLEIIQKSLYGVDKDTFAVNLARLRLWLALVVDDPRNPLDQPGFEVALPNLDFKVEQGDSLTAPNPESLVDLLQHQEYRADAERLRALYDEHFRPTGTPGKRRNDVTETEIKDLKAAISQLIGTTAEDGSMDWRIAFAEVFAGGGFDVVLANPPYVRADAQFKNIETVPERAAAIALYKAYRARLKASGIYSTLHEKWDLYVPFLERAHQLLRPGGQMIFIIPDAYNSNKYATKSHDLFLAESSIVRVDFCSEMDLFDAGVNNTILHFTKVQPNENHCPVRARRFGKDRNLFDTCVEILPTMTQAEWGATMFKASGQRNQLSAEGTIQLGDVCYITAGLVIHADEDGHLGEFTADDVLSEIRDTTHPKPFAFGKDILRWRLRTLRFLEWGTTRAPAHFRRPTFPELHNAKEKIISVRTPGTVPKSIYDSEYLHFDASCIGFVPWHYLRGVANKSIRKTAKYKREVKPSEPRPTRYREELEAISRRFSIKFVLGVMNSDYARIWISRQRRSKLHIYPDDWKQLPIIAASADQQAGIAALVEKCLAAKGVGCEAWEAEINERVARLYGV